MPCGSSTHRCCCPTADDQFGKLFDDISTTDTFVFVYDDDNAASVDHIKKGCNFVTGVLTGTVIQGDTIPDSTGVFETYDVGATVLLSINNVQGIVAPQ